MSTLGRQSRKSGSAAIGIVLGMAIAVAPVGSSLADGAGLAGKAGGSVSKLARSLARLRGEVEALAGQIEREKAELRARMRSLASQKAELEIQVKREQLRLSQLARRRATHHARVAKQNARRQRLAPEVAKLAAIVREALHRTLPFKKTDRQEEVDKIVSRAAQKLVRADAAIAQLWSRIEDELRLGRESGLYSQVLTLDGQQHLVEVARLGMVMLFFRSRDGRVGRVESTAEGRWRPVVIDDKRGKLAVARLFDSFKKQLRSGFFELPAAPGRWGAQ